MAAVTPSAGTFLDLPGQKRSLRFMRLFVAVMIGLVLAGGAHAQIRHVPLIGKNLERYSPERIDPRYAPHPSGGDTRVFSQRYAASAARGESWRIVSDCASACTIGFGHYPKNRICIGSWVKLGFHLGENERAAAQMWSAYPTDQSPHQCARRITA